VVVRTWRYAAGLALLGALASGLVGCTSSPAGSGSTGSSTVSGSAASTTTGSSSTSSVTSSATSTTGATLTYPADVPAEARVNSPAGAMAFARYFFAQVNKAYTTPQAGLIRPLSDATCLSCASFADNADGYVQKSQRYSTDPIRILEVSVAPDPEPQDGRLVDLVARQQKATLIDFAGRVQDSFSEKEGVFLINLRWSGQGWFVRKIQARQ
jgi:hypothetical protein